MNPAIDQVILTVGSSWALSTLVKATFIMVLVLCAVQLAGRKRAAFRHVLLAGAFGALLMLPVVSALAPPVRIAVRLRPGRDLVARGGGETRPVTVSHAGGGQPKQKPSRLPLDELLAASWIAGLAVFLLPVVAGLREVRRLRHSGTRWPQGQSVACSLASNAGIRRRVHVLLHPELAGPMTCGVARPVIVLPTDAPDWDTGNLDRALVHEIEHVIRRDWAIHCVARAVCAAYWFHPLAWIAWRRLQLEAERACDDAVLERSEATAYADQLVTLARRLSAASKSPLLAMANRADLASRVNAVLDRGQRRGRAGALSVTLAAVAVAALLVAVSPLRMVAAPQSVRAAGPRFRVDTRLVVTQAKVSYPNGNIVEGLGASDFDVTEDGVPQAIQLCEFQKEAGYYLLGYYPTNYKADGQFRKIDIVVKTATAATVDHRAGYYMTQPVASAEGREPATPAARPIPRPYDKPPVLIFKKEPEYTEEARKAKYQGTVLLDVDLDASGQVARLAVARSLGLGLDEKAIDAVKQWRFRPATKDGKPVAAETQVEVTFRLL